ncbi:MAG: AAA family ATPase [Oscillibacter sp.]|nr:AAA family ATPase [Oscillibacter sp.]
METMWTLHVENFGRIESADIEVSPLTLFVGDNNSGKSYLLALIYGLMCAENNGILSDLCEDSPEYKVCAECVDSTLCGLDLSADTEENSSYVTYELSFETDIFENLWNRILHEYKTKILRLIFNKVISADEISLKFPQGQRATVWYSISSAVEDDVYATIFEVLQSMIRGVIIDDRVFYFPTARTGFLLTYPALTKDAFSRAYNRTESQNPDLTLTRPCTDFLGHLTTVKKSNAGSQYKSIVRFIENGILHGKIVVSNDLPLPVFSYRPETMKTEIPMFLTSDVIKEMTPLLLALQYQSAEALFIEEPEMNLHPQLQQTMARVLVKLVNAGMPVFAATHSDTILQHINNMVKLSALPKKRQATLKKRFGFDKDDLIPADKISMYQFDLQASGKTAVRKLSCGQYGFEIPTFYAPLEALLRQTQDTEPGAEKYED